MVKKIINYILSLLLLLSLTTVLASFILRNFLASDNIEKMLFTDNKIIIENNINSFDDYVDEKELNKVYSSLLSNYFKYNIGIIKNKPTTDELKMVLNKYCDKYDSVNNIKINRSFIITNTEVLEKNLQQSMKLKNNKMNFILFLLNFNLTSYVAIGLCIILLVILFLINHDVLKIISDLSFIFMMDTVGMYALGVVLQYKLKEEIASYVIVGDVVKYLQNILNHIAIYSFLIGLFLLIIYIIIKIIKKKKTRYN